MGLIFLVTRPETAGTRRNVDTLVIIGSLAAGAITSFGFAQDKRRLVKRLEDDLREMEFEEELRTTDGGQPGKRAEKLLSINQHQLRRYYEQNLNQNSWIFFVGVLCLASGLALVGATLWLLVSGRIDDDSSKWMVAVVGGLGSVLTNYVAAVYLKMHAAATASLTGFHGRLVATHELFFANVLASRTHDGRRDEITCQIALAIVQGTRAQAARAEGPHPAAGS
jgi:type II secretory pathway pseudopilin PulG